MGRIDRTEEKVVKETVVEWYCDKCGKLIGETGYFDDGYCPNPQGAHEDRPLFKGFNASYSGPQLVLCDYCVEEFRSEVKNLLNTYYEEKFLHQKM